MISKRNQWRSHPVVYNTDFLYRGKYDDILLYNDKIYDFKSLQYTKRN
jgi:hypothetical protein